MDFRTHTVEFPGESITIRTKGPINHETKRMMGTNFSVGIERNEEQLLKNNADHTKWSNPLEIQYVFAPAID